LKLIHFVNLLSAADDYWNVSKLMPVPVEHRIATVAFDGEIDSVLLASPDVHSGGPIKLDYRVEVTPRGKVAVLELPTLLYWDMLIIRTKQ
jgi:hypothetical protein